MVSKIVDSERPVPVPDDLTRPYWDASKEHRLAIQRCQNCKTYYHPPLARCFECESRDLQFETVSGRGTVYSFTKLYDSRLSAFAAARPLPVVSVELVEQPWLLLTVNMADTESDDLKIGAPVEVTFIEISDGQVLPDFKLAAE